MTAACSSCTPKHGFWPYSLQYWFICTAKYLQKQNARYMPGKLSRKRMWFQAGTTYQVPGMSTEGCHAEHSVDLAFDLERKNGKFKPTSTTFVKLVCSCWWAVLLNLGTVSTAVPCESTSMHISTTLQLSIDLKWPIQQALGLLKNNRSWSSRFTSFHSVG